MGLYIQMHSMHGLFRGHHLELGRDEDTGGQILYVRYLALELTKLPEVDKVEIIVRRIVDPDYPGYSELIEEVAANVQIVRIECGPEKYIRKVELWPYLDEFIANCKKYIAQTGRKPDILHSHYADSGLVCARLSQELGIPQVHTCHSLGKIKMSRLGIRDKDFVEADKKYHFIERVAAEQLALDNSAALVVSTDEERLLQYSMYNVDINDGRFHTIPPGVNLNKFYPPDPARQEWDPKAKERLLELFNRELEDAGKPIVFAISRLDYQKNLISLIKAYAYDKELQSIANLVMVTGTLGKMGDNEQILMDEMLLVIDKYNLRKKICIVRHLDYKTEGGEIYRIVYASKGVFVNPAFHETFGFALLEAAATGVPVVTTNNGGPVEVLADCKCGVLIDSRDPKQIAEACKKILNDAELWRNYSEHGITAMKAHYTWQSTAQKEFTLFREILA